MSLLQSEQNALLKYDKAKQVKLAKENIAQTI